MIESNIKPGVYRTKIGFPYGPPGLEKHMDWCRENERKPNLKSFKEALDGVLISHEEYLKKEEGVTSPDFFPNPLAFLSAWKEGYKRKRWGGILDPISKGFELQFVTWDENSPYYKIEKDGKVLWDAVKWDGSLDGIVVATDLNGITDQVGYMCLGVNDLDNKEVLSYKSDRTLISIKNRQKWRRNTLIAGEDVYVTQFIGRSSGLAPEFPYSSVNPNKTVKYTWVMIEFSPHDVYDALRNLGFKFPQRN